MGKLYDLGIQCPFGKEAVLFELILDMFLSSPKGRPTSAKARGALETMLENI